MVTYNVDSISDIRKIHNLTSSEFGAKLGMSKQQVAILERGINKPSINTLLRIVNQFDVPLSIFFVEITTPQL